MQGGGGGAKVGIGEKVFYQRQLSQGLTNQFYGSEELSRYALPSLLDSFVKRNNIDGKWSLHTSRFTLACIYSFILILILFLFAVSVEDFEEPVVHNPPKEEDYEARYEGYVRQKALRDAADARVCISLYYYYIHYIISFLLSPHYPHYHHHTIVIIIPSLPHLRHPITFTQYGVVLIVCCFLHRSKSISKMH